MDYSKRRSTCSSRFEDDAEKSSSSEEKPLTPVYTSWPDMIRHWPKTTLCIVSNEFCERFSFYGMRTVLTLYLLNVLKFTDRTSTVFFNGFTVLCYITPFLGSIMADGFIGKFWTILSVSLLYAAGQIILAISSTQNFESNLHSWFDLLGLAVIGFGTGGIKPCVASFGADQFEQHQDRMLTVYFSMFYFSINAGSMISTFVSPIFRSQSCMGQDSCYPMAFGIPAVLMIVATGVFGIGSFWYKRPPVEINVFAEFATTIIVAIKNKFRMSVKREHWLDHYMDSHSCQYDDRCMQLRKTTNDSSACQKTQFVDDVKSFLRVLVMYLPVPMFWALYDQQGSVWTIQALQMNCRLWGNALLLPDQMQTLNAVLILAFIPFFQVVVYPLLSKCVKLTPLRKMVIGGVLAAASFVISGMVQFQVNTTLPDLPSDGKSFVSVMNTIEGCSLNVSVRGMSEYQSIQIKSNQSLTDDVDKKELFRLNQGMATFDFAYGPGCKKALLPTSTTYSLSGKKIHLIVVTENGMYSSVTKAEKPVEGNGEFGLMIHLAMQQNYTQNLALCRLPAEMKDYNSQFPCDPTATQDFYYWQRDYNSHTDDMDGSQPFDHATGLPDPHIASRYTLKSVRPGKYRLFYMWNITAKDVDRQTIKRTETKVNWTGVELEIEGQGGVYTLVLTGSDIYNATSTTFQVVPDNKMSILWQIPQYVVITAAEIFFSITGYEFAYSQAAPSMKSVVQAVWLLTTAAGDTIIVLIALWDPFSNMAIESMAYAGAMLVVIFIFALMSVFYYEYNYYTGEEAINSKSPAAVYPADLKEGSEFEKVEL